MTISRRTTTLLFFVASFLFGTTVFVVQVYHAKRFCVLFFFSIIFLKIIIAFWRLCFFFSLRRSPLPPLPGGRRRLRRGLSVCRGRSFRFEGCFSRKFFFFFFFSTKTEDWRKKWVLLNDVGKNTNHFIETLFSRGVRKILTTKMFVSLL